jgi:hypothetical protein
MLSLPPTSNYLLINSSLQAAWLQEFAFIFSSCLTKISVLVFYRRIFFTAEPIKQRLLIDVPIGFLVAYIFAVQLVLVLNCRPTNAYWMSMDPNYAEEYTCIDRHFFDPFKGSLSVLSDVYALLLPQFMIWKLNLKTESRWRLAILFGCGWMYSLLPSLVLAFKLIGIVQLAQVSLELTNSPDCSLIHYETSLVRH